MRHLVVLAISAIVLVACGNSEPGGPSAGLTLTKIGAADTAGVFGSAIQLTVLVERGGKPLASERVDFDVQVGGGSLSAPAVFTDRDGRATTLWLLGPTTGEQAVRASVAEAHVDFTATAAPPVVGQTYFGRNDYVEFTRGELPIILSSPHDGARTPNEIPNRTYGSTARDLSLMDLTRRAADALERLTGKRPHVAIMHLHRTKLDANREILEAAQSSPYAEWAWHEYHTWIDVARHFITADYGRGILLDLHGHPHPNHRIELGYQIGSADLNLPDATLNGQQYIDKSSIRNLGTTSPLPFSQLLRGEDSLGEILVRNGYPAIPSQSDPHPLNDPFFSHGYTLERHGSRDGGAIEAIMLEHDRAIRESIGTREAYVEALAKSIAEFLATHLDLDILPSGGAEPAEPLQHPGPARPQPAHSVARTFSNR